MTNGILKNKWVIVLIVFSIISFIISAILRLLTPQEVFVEKTDFISTNQFSDFTTFSNIRFVGSSPQAITKLPIATIQPSQTTLYYVKSQLIERYGLIQAVGIDGLWQGEDFNLSYNSNADEFLFYSLTISEKTDIIDASKAINIAQNFVGLAFPNLELAAQAENIEYLRGLRELELGTQGDAVAVNISFSYTVEGIPVYLAHERNAPITIMVNNQYEIQKVVFQPNFFNFFPSEGKLTLIDLGVALENINSNNEASIVSAFENETGLFTLDEVISGELETVRLEYRADLETGVAYPFYRFTGKLINEDGQTIHAQIITPAVKTQ